MTAHPANRAQRVRAHGWLDVIRLACCAIACAAALALSTAASAQPSERAVGEPSERAVDEPSERATAIYQQAREADDADELVRAAALYREAIALDPSARWASRTLGRLRALDRLTADPAIEALETIKLTYDSEQAAESIAQAAALLDVATTDLGRGEVHLWLGMQYARALDDAEQATAHFVAVESLPGASPVQLETAMLHGVRQAETRAQLLALRRAVISARANRTDLALGALNTPRDEVDDALMRQVAFPVAWVAIALLAALFIARRGWTQVRAIRPAAIGIIVYAFGTAAFLAERWEHGYAATFLCTIGAAIAVHGLTIGARPAPDASNAARWSTAAVVALASIAAVYLVFNAFNQQAVFGL